MRSATSHVTLQPTVALREEARQAAETALTLQPNLGEAVLPRAIITTPASRITTRRCITLSKHVSSCPIAAGFRNRWPMSRAGEASGTGASPTSTKPSGSTRAMLNCSPSTRFPISYLRRFPEALRKFDQVLNITPDDVDTLALRRVSHKPRAICRGRLHCSLRSIRTPTTPRALETQVYQAILERRPAPMVTRLKEVLAKPDPALGFTMANCVFG